MIISHGTGAEKINEVFLKETAFSTRIISMTQIEIIICPHCQQEVEVGNDMRGLSLECPHCKNSFVLPAPSLAPDPKPPVSSTKKTYMGEAVLFEFKNVVITEKRLVHGEDWILLRSIVGISNQLVKKSQIQNILIVVFGILVSQYVTWLALLPIAVGLYQIAKNRPEQQLWILHTGAEPLKFIALNPTFQKELANEIRKATI
jgi:hypothetical protein